MTVLFAFTNSLSLFYEPLHNQVFDFTIFSGMKDTGSQKTNTIVSKHSYKRSVPTSTFEDNLSKENTKAGFRSSIVVFSSEKSLDIKQAITGGRYQTSENRKKAVDTNEDA